MTWIFGIGGFILGFAAATIVYVLIFGRWILTMDKIQRDIKKIPREKLVGLEKTLDFHEWKRSRR